MDWTIGFSSPPLNERTKPILNIVTFMLCLINSLHVDSHLLTVSPKKEFEILVDNSLWMYALSDL